MKKGSSVTRVVLGLFVLALSDWSASHPLLQAQEAAQYFPVTGYTVQGRFLTYWQAHGGLAQFGYPLSAEFPETSDLDGKTYTVQYFERAVFEYHPEHSNTSSEVLLSLLGVFAYRARYGPAGAPGQQANRVNARFFPETGHTLGGRFRAYWEAHGGLAQQGYPLSDEFPERSLVDGQTYTVQYFERAVFEWHPEHAGTPYEVLLSPLGMLRDQARSPLADSADISSLDMVSAGEGWAVGFDYARGASFFLHYQGGRWRAQYPAALQGESLTGLDMVTADEGWAVGQNGIWHYHDGSWQAEAGQFGALVAVQMIAPAEGWAVGGAVRDSLLLHYTGHWDYDAIAPASPGVLLVDLAMLPSGNGWAAGAGGLMQRIGQRWEWQPVPGDVVLHSVAMVSEDEGWAIGNLAAPLDRVLTLQRPDPQGVAGLTLLRSAFGAPTILHYQNGQWSPVSLPLQDVDLDLRMAYLSRVRMRTASDGWIVGANGLILHYDGVRWSRYPSPPTQSLLNDVVSISAQEAWAVGRAGTILHYQNGLCTRSGP